MGVKPSELAYIKPVTQCEAEQSVVKFCNLTGIACEGIGPVVFYRGFTRAFLDGQAGTSEELIQSAVAAVDTIQRGKKIVVVDGVGYPAVGSICGISNADVARALGAPVLLVGKSGVGDAVDSFNLNAR
jgi:BioD-like phosphotransacetylase family protein